MAARIRKDDVVEVIAGAHRGARGKVLRVLPDTNRVLVEGVNMVYRHQRRTQNNPQGGRVHKEAPLHLSNVMVVDPRTDKPTRVRFETQTNKQGKVTGKKRVTVAGTTLNETRKSAAKKQA